jgi:hypothetical protein
MEWYNGQLAVTFRELTEPNPQASKDAAGMTVITVSNYKKCVREKKIQMLRAGKGLGNEALIAYESLPLRFKERFKRIWGDPYEVIEDSMHKDEVFTDSRAVQFFAEYRFENGNHIPDEFQREYVQNASVLNCLLDILKKRKSLRTALKNNTGGVWDTVEGTVERLRDNPGHTLPKSFARVKVKIREYKKEGYACLISGKLGNQNSIKITAEGGLFLVMQKRRRVPVLSDEDIFDNYNRVAPQYGWKELLSVESVTNYLNAPENKQRWYDAVHGELKAFQKYGYKFRTELPSFRDALWYGDGTKLNLYYKAYEGGKLVVKTTMVYEVIDAYSEMLLGCHISDTENYEAQYNAYRMAVENAQARPFEIVVDNQGGTKKLANLGFMQSIARLQRTTTPYRPQAKLIESVFGRLQKQILKSDWRFTGANITARSEDSRPNLDLIMENTDKLFTLDELKEAYAAFREEWNSQPHPTTGIPRKEMYRSSINPEAAPLDRLDMIELFWLITRRPSTFTTSGIEIQVNKKTYAYDVYDEFGMPDMEFRKKHIGRQFLVQYDPNDMTRVRLYEQTASGPRYVTEAAPYIRVKRATQEASFESSSFIRRVLNLEEQLRVDTYLNNIRLEHEFGVALEQNGLRRPKPKGISKRAIEEIIAKHGNVPETASRTGQKDTEVVDIGKYQKELSNVTYDELAMYDKL